MPTHWALFIWVMLQAQMKCCPRKHMIWIWNVDQNVEAMSWVWDVWTGFPWDMQLNLSRRQLEMWACSLGQQWEIEMEIPVTSAWCHGESQVREWCWPWTLRREEKGLWGSPHGWVMEKEMGPGISIKRQRKPQRFQASVQERQIKLQFWIIWGFLSQCKAPLSAEADLTNQDLWPTWHRTHSAQLPWSPWSSRLAGILGITSSPQWHSFAIEAPPWFAQVGRTAYGRQVPECPLCWPHTICLLLLICPSEAQKRRGKDQGWLLSELQFAKELSL